MKTTSRTLVLMLVAFIVGTAMRDVIAQRPLAESMQNIPVGSCFPETGQCWDGTRWAPKPAPFKTKAWPLAEKLPVYVIETTGVCLYVIDYTDGQGSSTANAHTALWGVSKRDLPTGAGCQ